MAQSQRGGEPLCLRGGALGDLSFEWSHDRYSHRWIFPESDSVVASVESDSSAVWPASPPLQQIHQQSFADGRQIIFGVGMAGRGHWSASLTLVPDLKCWIVELACRAPAEPDRLESTYLLSGDWQQVADNAFTTPHANQQLQLEAISPGSIAVVQDSQVSIRPMQMGTGAATTQWAFRLRVS